MDPLYKNEDNGKGKEKEKEEEGELLKQGPFTISLVQENTSANNVSVCALFKGSNLVISNIQGTRICSYAPTPGGGNGCNGIPSISAMPFEIEKRYEELRLVDYQLTGRTGNPNLFPELAMPLAFARNIADLETKRKATSEGMMDGLKENMDNFKGKGKEVAGDDATASQLQEEAALGSLVNGVMNKNDLLGSTSAHNNEKAKKAWFERIDVLLLHVLNATKIIAGFVVLYMPMPLPTK